MGRLTESEQQSWQLRPGEEITYTGTSKSGASKTVRLRRTSQPYDVDLLAAYNEQLHPSALEKGLRWLIGNNGEFYLGCDRQTILAGVKADKERLERERQDYKRNMEQAATAERPFAKGEEAQ